MQHFDYELLINKRYLTDKEYETWNMFFFSNVEGVFYNEHVSRMFIRKLLFFFGEKIIFNSTDEHTMSRYFDGALLAMVMRCVEGANDPNSIPDIESFPECVFDFCSYELENVYIIKKVGEMLGTQLVYRSKMGFHFFDKYKTDEMDDFTIIDNDMYIRSNGQRVTDKKQL